MIKRSFIKGPLGSKDDFDRGYVLGYEDGFDQAYQRAYDQGFQDGFRAALARLKKEREDNE